MRSSANLPGEMTATAKKLLAAALKLRPEERLALAEELMGSEPETASADEVNAAWKDELQRRSDSVKRAAVKLSTWPEAERRLRSRIKGGR